MDYFECLNLNSVFKNKVLICNLQFVHIIPFNLCLIAVLKIFYVM